MKKELTFQEKKLYWQMDEVLHYMWDPIGVRGIAQARDEYHAYLPHVFSLVLKESKSREIASYLVKIEKDSMGLSPNKKNAKEIAGILLEMREAIIEDGF